MNRRRCRLVECKEARLSLNEMLNKAHDRLGELGKTIDALEQRAVHAELDRGQYLKEIDNINKLLLDERIGNGTLKKALLEHCQREAEAWRSYAIELRDRRNELRIRHADKSAIGGSPSRI